MDLGENQSPQENFTLKPISRESFYGKNIKRVNSSLCHIPELLLCPDLSPLPQRLSKLLGPSQTWKVFKRQKEALDCAKTRGNGLMTFAFQQESGQRLFLVAHPAIFWHYDSKRNMKCRCSYEVIPENAPCKIYFDLEFDRKININSIPERMVKIFLSIVFNHINNYFQFAVDLSKVLILDSSTDVKFSNHLIFQGVFFKDNIHLGRFVKEMCSNIKRAVGYEKVLCEQPQLWVNITHSEISELLVVDRKNEKRLFCDECVYTKNRQFRIYCSTKLGKNSPLLLSTSNEYLPAKDVPSKDQLFLDSLVTYVVDSDLKIIEYGKNVDVPSQRESSVYEKRIECSTTDQNSSFYQVDNFVKGLISPQGWIRRKTVLKQQRGQRVLYDIEGDRYCANIGRQHRSNKIYIVVDGSGGTWYQKCYDPECRGSKSVEKPLPPEISFLVDSEDLHLSQEDNSDLWEDFAGDGEVMVDFGSFGNCNEGKGVFSDVPCDFPQIENTFVPMDFPDYGITDSELMEAASNF